jgi:hypothetical protein
MDVTQTTNNLPQTPIPGLNFSGWDNFFHNISQFFYHLFNPSYHIPYAGTGFKLVLAILAIFFVFIITYTFVRLLEIRKKEHEYLHHQIEEYAHRHAEIDKKAWEDKGSFLNKRWEIVLEYLFSENAGDWKLAVIEADSMLDGLMDQLGFKGENLGEKLKGVNQENFKSLTTAWEVHTIRNRIAHEGAEFDLSQHEAKRVIALYEQIFRTFGYI